MQVVHVDDAGDRGQVVVERREVDAAGRGLHEHAQRLGARAATPAAG